MGIGDELMVTGEVRRLAAATPGIRVAIRAMHRPDWHRWHPIWEGNPNIARPREAFDAVLDNAPGYRPYIVAKGPRQWVWREYRPIPGAVYLTERERAFAAIGAGRIVIQPFIKSSASPNKRWPMEYWQAMIEARRGWPWLQVGDGSEPKMAGIEFIQTKDFREACGVLSSAAALVAQEGGLHHAAAALGTPSP